MSTQAILNAHPAPWRYLAAGGDVYVMDAENKRVELFTLLDFCVKVTTAVARADAADKAQQPA